MKEIKNLQILCLYKHIPNELVNSRKLMIGSRMSVFSPKSVKSSPVSIVLLDHSNNQDDLFKVVFVVLDPAVLECVEQGQKLLFGAPSIVTGQGIILDTIGYWDGGSLP